MLTYHLIKNDIKANKEGKFVKKIDLLIEAKKNFDL